MSHRDTTQCVAANLRAELGRQRVSGRALARRLGVDPMWLHRRLVGTSPITVDDLVLFATALDVPPTSLLPETDAA